MQNNPLSDIQKVAGGIDLARFDPALRRAGVVGRFAVEDSGFETDDQPECIVTHEVNC